MSLYHVDAVVKLHHCIMVPLLDLVNQLRVVIFTLGLTALIRDTDQSDETHLY